MDSKSLAIAAVAAGALVWSLPQTSAASDDSSVAVVTSVLGRALARRPPKLLPEPLSLFDWLPAGTTIEVTDGSRLTLALSGGSRFELGAKARARVETTGLSERSGVINDLPAVPPMPSFPAILEATASRPAAARIRRQTITEIYPDASCRTLAHATTLRFAPVEGAAGYRVEIDNEEGHPVFQVTTEASSIAVPAGVLRPAGRYLWRVRSVRKAGFPEEGTGEINVLDAEATGRRLMVRKSLESSTDPASLALLAELDRRLGLLDESVSQLRVAVARHPEDRGLAEALRRAEREREPESQAAPQ